MARQRFLSLILATFMGGTCLGSLIFPRVSFLPEEIRSSWRSWKSVLLLRGCHSVCDAICRNPLYGLSGTGISGFAAGVVAASCLLPPTLLMGFNSALARAIETPSRIPWMGYLYGCNIGGAVSGCLVAGFYLLPKYDVATATFVAAAINVSVGGVALTLSSLATEAVPDDTAQRSADVRLDGVVWCTSRSRYPVSARLRQRRSGHVFSGCCLGRPPTRFRSFWQSFSSV